VPATSGFVLSFVNQIINMKLVSYLLEEHDQLAVLVNGLLYDMENLHPDLPNSMSMFLNYWEDALPIAQGGVEMIEEGKIAQGKGIPVDSVQILAPIPLPTSCRDGYAFRQHVAAARRNRKVEMIPEFDQYPIFYFTNHHSIKGPGEISCMPDHFEKLGEKIKKHFKIYMLSSSIDNNDKLRAVENKNVVDYIEKPLTEQKVFSLLKTVKPDIS